MCLSKVTVILSTHSSPSASTMWKYVNETPISRGKTRKPQELLTPDVTERSHWWKPQAQAAQAWGGGVRAFKIEGNVWIFVTIAINHSICHEIQNKLIVPVSDGPLCPLCWSKAATATINSRKFSVVFPRLKEREGWRDPSTQRR